MVIQPTIIRSSLVLEILLTVNLRYSVLFYLYCIGAFVYKLSYLPYSTHVGICEAAIILLFGPIELIRINWARRGNITEVAVFLWLSLLLSLAVGSACIYLAFFQAYMALIEQIGAYIQLGLLAIEAALKLGTIVSLSSK